MKNNNMRLLCLGLVTTVVLSGMGWLLSYDKNFSYLQSQANVESVEIETPRERHWNKYLSELKLNSDLSVFIQDETDVLAWNNHRVRAAGMIKPFIMADVFEQVKQGKLRLDDTVILKASDKVGGAGRLTGYPSGTALTIRQLVTSMIASDDNTATNILINLLGMKQINEYISSQGYRGTILQSKMMDADAVRRGHENYTTAEDLGNLFVKLRDGRCVSSKADREMIYILLQQESKETFDTALPNKRIAHSVGDQPGLLYDGGIIYNEELKQPYVLVVLNDNYRSRSESLELIWKVTRQLSKISEEN